MTRALLVLPFALAACDLVEESCVDSNGISSWCNDLIDEAYCDEHGGIYAAETCADRGYTRPCDPDASITSYSREGDTCPSERI